MRRTILLASVVSLVVILCTQSCKVKVSDKLPEAENIKTMLLKTADWQLANLPTSSVFSDRKTSAPIPDNGWVRGAFFTGVMALYRTTGLDQYLNAAKSLSAKVKYMPGPRPFHADDHVIIQTYAQIFEASPDSQLIKPSIALLDTIIQYPHLGSQIGWADTSKNWWWCDAIYMAPPAYFMLTAITKSPKYADTAMVMFRDSKSYLYSTADSLWFRDSRFRIFDNDSSTFNNKRTSHGQKIFWGRGNGWVIAGLCRMLDYTDKSSDYRPELIDTYKQMAYKIAKLQHEDGMWRASLIDPNEFPQPESSCTGFFVYALTWGVNNGILPRSEFEPVIAKGWNALTSAVSPEGKLGWVQMIGHDPKEVTADDTMEYGTGAYLLAGTEILKMLNNSK